MYFDFIKRNSKKVRKENGVYFTSLVISIVAFYVILSLEQQDVMVYLKTIESDAVAKLLLLIPMLYGLSLFFMFFLVYFANKYQLQRRSHELGIYLIMGMKRKKLFAMIMGETLWNGLVALSIGIPISLFLTELISLVTSRIIGMGIIGHQFKISWTGLGFTILGFIVVQLLAVFILTFLMSRKEIIGLMKEQKEKVQKILSPKWGWSSLVIGVTLLSLSYVLAILYFRNLNILMFAFVLLSGISGTFILFRGLGTLIGGWTRHRSNSTSGLFTFTARQLQENVFHQYGSLAISSLLLLVAMVCFAYGGCASLNRGETSERSVDFTFDGSEKEVVSALTCDDLKPYVKEYYPMKLDFLKTLNKDRTENKNIDSFSWGGLEEVVSREKSSLEKENLLKNLSYQDRPYLISLTSYNSMLKSINESEIELGDNEVAMYSSSQFSSSYNILRKALKSNPRVSINEKEYKLTSTLYTMNLVADRAITLSYALIVPDHIYSVLVENPEKIFRWNMVLDSELVREKSLMQAMYEVNEKLSSFPLKYESYLSSMGRQIFYIVAGSYTTLYLGIMFLIIANTVIGLKFLMQQRSTMHRYSTLFMLGASVKSLCLSARRQICWYFGLSITVAVISSIFGVWSMLGTFLPTLNKSSSNTVIFIVAIVLMIFIIFELCYILIIQRKSDEEIRNLKHIQ